MQLAKFGDKLEIEILGVDHNGIPDAIRIEYFRNGHRIKNHPAFTRTTWAALRKGAFELISQWWKQSYFDKKENRNAMAD